jgi:hypothetical protein
LRLLRTAFLLSAALSAAIAASAGAVSIRWHPAARIEPLRNGGFSAVSCPSSKLCVAVDQSGFIVTSKDPAGGPKKWSPTIKIDPRGTLTGISCPTTNFCAAVDAAGNVLTSTRPTNGANAWSKPVRIDTTTDLGGEYVGLAGISCASPTMCVAVDQGTPANVVYSSKPAGGATQWTVVQKVADVLTSVDCQSPTLCVAVGIGEYESNDPTSPTGVWKPFGTPATDTALSAIDCPSATLCVAASYGDSTAGTVMTAVDPKTATLWTPVGLQADPPSPGSGMLDGISCLSGSFCVALDSADNVFTSTSPSKGLWGPQTEIAPASATLGPINSAISCAPTLCAVVDSNGYVTVGTRKQ